jgi:hypothetical protein
MDLRRINYRMQPAPNKTAADHQCDILIQMARKVGISTYMMNLLITEGYLENYYDLTTLSRTSLLKFAADHKFP